MIYQESIIQKGVIRWRDSVKNYSFPEVRWLHAIPNGGQRKGAVGILVGEGMLRGVHDLFLPWPSAGFHGMYLETKKPGGQLSEEQLEFHHYVLGAGYHSIIYDDWAVGVGNVVMYLEPDLMRMPDQLTAMVLATKIAHGQLPRTPEAINRAIHKSNGR